MAQDRPTASEFLAAITDFLREEATPALDKADPRLGFQMRVAVNSLAILEREGLLGPDGTLADLNRELARQLRAGERDERDGQLMAHLDATIADKIAIANPK